MITVIRITISIVTAVVLHLFVSNAAHARTLEIDSKNLIVINSEINGAAAVEASNKLTKLALDKKAKQVDIIIDSPGGSIIAGMVLVNTMKRTQARGTIIRCVVPRYAASMAFQIFSYCNERYMMAESFVLWHAPRVYIMFGVLLPDSASQLARSLKAWEDLLLRQLRMSMLPTSRRKFYQYYDEEKFVMGSELKGMTRGFVTIIDDMTGVKESAWNPTLKQKRSKGARSTTGTNQGMRYGEITYICSRC